MLSKVKTIDLNFLSLANTIAVYLIPHAKGVVLVESGPGSTLCGLEAGLQAYGYEFKDITDVFITHIHLDHAGASGALARCGARIHVHPKGAVHMVDPEKLLNSARRIYGDAMDYLWGEFLPVPEKQLSVLEDGAKIKIGDVSILALYTPGHANHHICYLFEDVCFSGDVGSCRIKGQQYLSMPYVPPEFHLELWQATVDRLRQVEFKYIAPTHFGIFNDVHYHMNILEQNLEDVEAWMEKVMPADPPLEEISRLFQEWTHQKFQAYNLTPEMRRIYEAANPSFMAAAAIQRYWHKYRLGEDPTGDSGERKN